MSKLSKWKVVWIVFRERTNVSHLPSVLDSAELKKVQQKFHSPHTRRKLHLEHWKSQRKHSPHEPPHGQAGMAI